jgi:hypothetical protein
MSPTKWRTTASIVLGLALLTGIPGQAVPKKAPNYVDLDNIPKPKITGKQIISGLEQFVEKFPLRQWGTPNNTAASEFLAKEAKKYGFRTKILELQGGTLGFGAPSRTVRVVEAVKRGTTKPNEWIGLVAHYDIVPGAGGATYQGAYDDGSGTNMLRYFVRAFSKVKTKRSIAILWFDSEEWGLSASEAYAARAQKRGQKFAAVFGFDMVGIGYPAPYCICIYYGKRIEDEGIARPIIDYVNFDYLKFPEGDGGSEITARWPFGEKGHVCSCGPNPRNSDEQSFGAEGYFTMRWAGMRRAADYPGYHYPWDTVDLMETVAGSRKALEKGTENIFKSAYYTVHVIDRL